MYSKKETRIEVLTPELAKEIAAMPGLPGERELRRVRVRFLENKLNDGVFVGPNWAIAQHAESGQQYRINGQHSSHMLSSLGAEAFPADLKVTIDVYEFTDLMQDAGGLFNLFDHPKSARTDTDFMGISKAHFAEFADMENRFLVRVASGIDANLHIHAERTGVQAIMYTHRDQGQYFVEDRYRQFAVWLYQWKDAVHFDFTSRAGVTAEILDDWQAAPEVASEFWAYVFLENHQDPDHESRELVREIQSLGNKAQRITTAEYKKKTQKFWSKYYRLRKAEGRGGVQKPGEDEAPSLIPETGVGIEAQL